jgi:hypothetical protein
MSKEMRSHLSRGMRASGGWNRRLVTEGKVSHDWVKLWGTGESGRAKLSGGPNIRCFGFIDVVIRFGLPK